MGYWAEAPLPRDQILLIPVTLGDRIPVDHPVRLFDEILSSLDFSKWENHYCRVAGQPAIPPRIVAGAILYGLSHGLGSSRRLEWACGNAVDFMWLGLHGLQPPKAGKDHGGIARRQGVDHALRC